MADQDKTDAGARISGGGTGAAEDPAGSGAPPPEAPEPDPARPDPARPDPTRYGDWEINGRCIDF